MSKNNITQQIYKDFGNQTTSTDTIVLNPNINNSFMDYIIGEMSHSERMRGGEPPMGGRLGSRRIPPASISTWIENREGGSERGKGNGVGAKGGRRRPNQSRRKALWTSATLQNQKKQSRGGKDQYTAGQKRKAVFFVVKL